STAGMRVITPGPLAELRIRPKRKNTTRSYSVTILIEIESRNRTTTTTPATAPPTMAPTLASASTGTPMGHSFPPWPRLCPAAAVSRRAGAGRARLIATRCPPRGPPDRAWSDGVAVPRPGRDRLAVVGCGPRLSARRGCQVPHGLAGIDAEREDGQRRRRDAVGHVALDVGPAGLGRAVDDEIVDDLVRYGSRRRLAVPRLPGLPHGLEKRTPSQPLMEGRVHADVQIGGQGEP